jgi:hypothetical protein
MVPQRNVLRLILMVATVMTLLGTWAAPAAAAESVIVSATEVSYPGFGEVLKLDAVGFAEATGEITLTVLVHPRVFLLDGQIRQEQADGISRGEFAIFLPTDGTTALVPRTITVRANESTPGGAFEAGPATIRLNILLSVGSGFVTSLSGQYEVLLIPDKADPATMVGDLRTTVQGMSIKQGVKNGLLAKLDAAHKSAREERYTATRNQLGAFINQVSAQSGKALTAQQARELTNSANAILAELPR